MTANTLRGFHGLKSWSPSSATVSGTVIDLLTTSHVFHERKREDYQIGLARRADEDDKTLTLALVRKVLRIGHRKDVYR